MLQKKDNLLSPPVLSIARVLYADPLRAVHLRQLSRESKLSTTTTRAVVQFLAKEGIVTLERGVLLQIKPSLSPAYVAHKRMFNMYELYSSGFVNALESFLPEAVVVFGSYAKGEDVKQSDIDVLVVAPEPDTTQFRKTYEKRLGRLINVHVLDSLEKSETAFKEAIANGLVLSGRVMLGEFSKLSSARQGKATDSGQKHGKRASGTSKRKTC